MPPECYSKPRVSYHPPSQQTTCPHELMCRLVLTYLIPLQLMRGRLPSSILLSRFPRLEELYTPFLEAIRAGNAQKFDAALARAEPRLLQQNTWIAVEKAREVCMRGLLKHVYVFSSISEPSDAHVLMISYFVGIEMDGIWQENTFAYLEYYGCSKTHRRIRFAGGDRSGDRGSRGIR
jgi:hypothetical protein